MSELLFKQFEMTRGFFIKGVEAITTEQANIQPEGYKNNIHWHIGHVLTVTEQFMTGFPQKSEELPVHYLDLFGNGTSPASWEGNVPPLEELTEQLNGQLERIRKIPAERFNKKLKKPFLGLETFGELANLSLYHESHHLGQIHAMKRLVD
ncbi:DinB family protein [Bacillus sp. REN3]|uniref:DinB family protein n=1 Tax=Bacillus sp. REN3 TaxID=2802440 RepID=UPI001AEF2942|nr:DinB family protein [Bacillus sp. REN3]